MSTIKKFHLPVDPLSDSTVVSAIQLAERTLQCEDHLSSCLPFSDGLVTRIWFSKSTLNDTDDTMMLLLPESSFLLESRVRAHLHSSTDLL